MCKTIEILKDGTEVCYESWDIAEFDDLVCFANPKLPRIDLTKVKSIELTAERVSSEVYYKNITSVSRSSVRGIATARTDTVEPVEVPHSTYYAYLKFQGERKERKFILDEEIAHKIQQIQEDRDFIGNYEPTYHPSNEEMEEAENLKKKNERIGCAMIAAIAVAIILWQMWSSIMDAGL